MAALQIGVLFFLAIVSTYSSAQDDMESVPVVLGEVISSSTGSKSILTCEVISQFPIILSASIDAELNYLAPIGQLISENGIVASQESFYVENELRKSQALLQSQIQSSTFHSQEKDRTERQGSLITQSERERSKWQSNLSENEVTLRQIEIERLKHDLNKATLRVDGLYEVTQHYSKLGQFVLKGELIAEVVPLADKELACELPLTSGISKPEMLTYVVNGQKIKFNRASSVINKNTQSRTIYLMLTPSVDALIGQRMDVDVTNNDSGLVKVPYDAINFDPSGSAYVWYVNEENRASRVTVNIIRGGSDSENQTISGDLPDTGSVVIMGAESLDNGTLVSVSNIES